MDPVTAIMGITSLIGLGTSLFGTAKSVGASQQAAGISSQIYGVEGQIVGVEQQQNYQKYQAMLYGSQRQEMENLRKTQQSMAQVRSNAVNSGAQFGSEPKTGEGAAAAGGAFNTGGLLQSLKTGTAMYGLSNQITGFQETEAGLKSQLATAQGNVAAGQGIASMGSAITGASGPLGRLGGSLFS
jgi:hypothetical protein